MDLEKGEAILIPAIEKRITLTPRQEFKLLESYIE
jgi:hypothetical protein